jgi:hypothetical protein
MNAETFAEWLRLRGYNVVRTPSSYWYEASPRVYQAFPYHWLIHPSQQEISNLLHEHGAIALRHSAPIQKSAGVISYHTVYDKDTYELDDLDRRARQNVRKGLNNCVVGPASFELLAEEGWCLEMDTADRQSRHISTNKEKWRCCYQAAAGLPGFEGWGAFVDGRLVASLLTFQMNDCCEMISQQCNRDYLSQRVNNALCFVVTQTMVKRPEVRSIFYSLCSLDAPPSVDEFKFRMGYSSKPVCQRVVFHPRFAPLVNPITHNLVRWALQRNPGSHFLAKAEGMFRLYLNGKQPLSEQEWPECLAECKKMLLRFLSSSREIPDQRFLKPVATEYGGEWI